MPAVFCNQLEILADPLDESALSRVSHSIGFCNDQCQLRVVLHVEIATGDQVGAVEAFARGAAELLQKRLARAD